MSRPEKSVAEGKSHSTLTRQPVLEMARIEEQGTPTEESPRESMNERAFLSAQANTPLAAIVNGGAMGEASPLGRNATKAWLPRS